MCWFRTLAANASPAWAGWLLLPHSRRALPAVIEGGARDVDEINDCGFAVIARHFVPIGAKTRIRLVACNVPVKVDGIAVTPGDIVVADSSAIAVVPGRVAADVAEAALECCRNDDLARAAIARHIFHGGIPQVSQDVRLPC